jgi:IS605 OrfB family transposase
MYFSRSCLFNNLHALNLLGALFNLPPFVSCISYKDAITDPSLQLLLRLQLPHPKSKEFSLLLFLIKHDKICLSDKLHYMNRDSLTNTLTIINIPDLIINNPVLSCWWNSSITELSSKTWMPDTSTKCIEKCLPTMGSNTWFSVVSTQSTNIPKRVCKRSYTDTLNSNSNTPNGIMKIRLYPNQHQKNVLQQMFDANRYSYNKIIEVIGNKMFDFTSGVFNTAFKEARKYVTKKHMKDLGIPERIINVNNVVLDSAYRDVNKARDSMIAASIAKKAKTGKGFMLDKLKYRSKKLMTSETIEIPSREIDMIKEDNDLFVSFFTTSFKPKKEARTGRRTKEQIKIDKENEIKRKSAHKIRIAIPLPKLQFSIRLQMIKPNIYYLCIPISKTVEPITTNKICSVDPGVRTMLTVFDPEDKQVYMIGNNVEKLVELSKKIDIMKSKLRKFRGKRNARYRLKKNMQFIQRKIKNMTNDMHHKTSKFLSENYKTIIYPKFNVKGMCKKKNRNIGKETVRRMYLWAHYRFRELLKYKTALRGGKVVDCTEEYTSKTCTCCGRLNHILGASKKFKCPYCKYEVDRDIGAARNIYLKNHRVV